MISDRIFHEQGNLGRSLALSFWSLVMATALVEWFVGLHWLVAAYAVALLVGAIVGSRRVSGRVGRSVARAVAVFAWAEMRPVLMVLLVVAAGACVVIWFVEQQHWRAFAAMPSAGPENPEWLKGLLFGIAEIELWRERVIGSGCVLVVVTALFSGLVDGLWIGGIARVSPGAAGGGAARLPRVAPVGT